ncbi:MAG: Sec-independent protein translocase protein TatC [Turneriella sp.]|nr:Sec-independent protein translocase protein TatC [Turneriella sp.]
MPLDQEIGNESSRQSAANASLKKLRKDQGFMPMAGHLNELRTRLMRSLLWILIFSTVSYFFYARVWDFIMGPVAALIRKSRLPDMPSVKIMTTRLGDNFAIEFKILLLAGFILAFPFILFEIWRFITPALSEKFRRKGSVILLASMALFWSGVIFARLVTWGTVADFLIFQWLPPPVVLSATESIRPEVNLTVADYLSFFTGFHLAFGLSFQLPIVSVLLGSLGIVSSRLYFRYWRHAIVVLCLFSIVVMPPDVFAMLTLMVPMMVLYFLSGFLVKTIEKRQIKG